jgi:hypothetical protein
MRLLRHVHERGRNLRRIALVLPGATALPPFAASTTSQRSAQDHGRMNATAFAVPSVMSLQSAKSTAGPPALTRAPVDDLRDGIDRDVVAVTCLRRSERRDDTPSPAR